MASTSAISASAVLLTAATRRSTLSWPASPSLGLRPGGLHESLRLTMRVRDGLVRQLLGAGLLQNGVHPGHTDRSGIAGDVVGPYPVPLALQIHS
jgi:hypothetical protein